jgi:hypothetical protein
MKLKRLHIILIAISILLLIPLIAMQFTNEVNWSVHDFVIAGILLFGAGLLCELALRKIKPSKYRIVILAGILLVLFIIWAELAVGIFGTPFGGH